MISKFASAAALLVLLMSGCRGHRRVVPEFPPPTPLGAQVNKIYQTQQANAESAKYTIPTNEFRPNDPQDLDGKTGWRLTTDGEDHVKQIARNLRHGEKFPVIIQRSHSSIRQETQFKYPIHANEELDEARRRIVVAALETFGVPDAGQLVVVGPLPSEGYTGVEAANAYNNAIQNGLNGTGGSNSSQNTQGVGGRR